MDALDRWLSLKSSASRLRLRPSVESVDSFDTVPWLPHIQLRGSVERVVARINDRGPETALSIRSRRTSRS
jgi:hypothetical protein